MWKEKWKGREKWGERERERERDRTKCYHLCGVLFVFYFLIFKYRKTGFGLNLKEAENGMAVALGRELLSKETSTWLSPPAPVSLSRLPK